MWYKYWEQVSIRFEVSVNPGEVQTLLYEG